MRFIACLLAGGSLVSCSEDGIKELGPDDSSTSLKTGDEVRILPGPPQDDMEWFLGEDADPAVMRYLGGSSLVGVVELHYMAVGPGETHVALGQRMVREHDQVAPGLTWSFTVTGDPIPDPPGPDLGLQGVEIVGGFGTSVASGSALPDLQLFPTDMVRGDNDHLFVASEGRLWDINPQSMSGSIVVDTPGDGGASPEGSRVVSAAPLNDGGFLAVVHTNRDGYIIRIDSARTSHSVIRHETATSDGLSALFGRIRASSDGSKYVTNFNGKQVRDDGDFPFPDNDNQHIQLQIDRDGVPNGARDQAHGLDDRDRYIGWTGGADFGELSIITESGLQQQFLYGNEGAELHEQSFSPILPTLEYFAPVWELSDGSYWSYTLQMPEGQSNVETAGSLELPGYRGHGLFRHR